MADADLSPNALAGAGTGTPETEAKTSDLLPRLLSGIVMIAGAIAALYYGGLIWAGAIAFCAILLCFEWPSMVQGGGKAVAEATLLSILVLFCLGLGMAVGPITASAACAGLAFIFACLWLVQPGSVWGWFSFGVLYITLPCLAMIWLRDQVAPPGLVLILFLFIVVWATDIGAYFAGRAIGGPKLFPIISPKKTWAGAIGGLLAAASLACLLKPAFALDGGYLALAGAASLLSIIGQLGDALESALKRGFGVKDSGSIIPGHGGVFDRLDSLLLCAPILAITIWISTP